MNKNIPWINAVKAICMIAVYLLHSEAYYGINTISYGQMVQPFYVNAFFFVSGYLFFKKHLSFAVDYNLYSFRKDIQNIVFRLIIPTILFASLIYVPKLIFHSKEISVMHYFYDAFGGVSFWFTSALAVSQILLFCLLLTRKQTIWFYLICSILMFFFSIYLSNIYQSRFPWYYKSGMGATMFLTLGGIYQLYESKVDKKIGVITGSILVVVYPICMLYGIIYNNPYQYAMMSMNFDFEGLVISLLGIAVIILICKHLPKLSILEFIRKNSIIFYFFSGAFPAFIGLVFQKIFPDKLYIITLTVALLSICAGYLMTYIVINFLPWLTDLRKLKK